MAFIWALRQSGSKVGRPTIPAQKPAHVSVDEVGMKAKKNNVNAD
jgi:hypothetical protein